MIEVVVGVALFGAVLGLSLGGMVRLSVRSVERADRADRLAHVLRLLEHLQQDLERAVATEEQPRTSATRCTLTLDTHPDAGPAGAAYRFDPTRGRLERSAAGAPFRTLTTRPLTAVRFDVRPLESAQDATALVTISIEDNALSLQTVRVVRPATEGVGPVFWNEPEQDVSETDVSSSHE